MKHLVHILVGLLAVLAAVDILILSDVNRGLLTIVIAANILTLAKIDSLKNYEDRKLEQEDLLLSLVDKVCSECQSGQELFLDSENFYCHWSEEDQAYIICLSHPIHDMLNSWAAVVEE